MDSLRTESKILFAIIVAATALTYQQINWWHYLALFWVIDVVGYWPGLLYSKITGSERVPQVFYLLYNAMHNLATLAVLVIAYVYFSDTPYSALSVPLHLAIDRGLLGNYHKNSSYAFHQGGLQS